MSRMDKIGFDPIIASFLPDFYQPTRSAKIAELLGHNNLPTDSEHAYLKSVIAEGEAALAVLDHKIKAACQLLEALKAERGQAIANVADANFVLHPIRMVPDDVLYVIFSACVDLEKSCPRESCPYTGEAPWTLSRVCRSWRNISIRTTKLWTFIRVDIMDTFHGPRPHNLEHLLRKRLERAKGRDLELQYESLGEFSNLPIFRVLLASAPYWHKAKMIIGDDKELEAIRQNGSALSRLQSLGIFLTARSLAICFHHLFGVFEMSPNLRRLAVGSFESRGWEYMGPEPTLLGRITHLSISAKLTSSFFFVDILPHMQNLKSLALGGHDELISSEAVELPNLSSLCIRGQSCTDQGVANTYSHLTVPALQALEVGTETGIRLSYPIITHPDLITRLHISPGKMRLTLGDVQRLIDFLRKLRNLHYLWLSCTHIPSDFFREMSVLPDVAPHLAHFHSVGSHQKQVAIIEFARSRWSAGSLSKVTLGESFQPAVAEQWQALCDEGLLIDWDLGWDRYRYKCNAIEWDT
ncbi:hypothetical protein DFS33DRAFT_1113768 [Desarmillaria ectypa]|nr:hypothetical protein DFS33DRAFT_1113768 [Desarmillaria ectypa]